MPNQTATQYPGHVTMRRNGETWDCPASYVDTARKQGWKPVDDNAPGLFDPTTKSVEQVNAYLAGDVTDEERDRVLNAERANKNRITITGD